LKRLKTSDYKSALLKKGFRQERKTDHEIFFLYVGEKKTQIFTMVSFGSSKDINDPLLDKIKLQLRLTNKQIQSFIECPMTGEEYLAALKSRGEKL
jgi:hypothetical protein